MSLNAHLPVHWLSDYTILKLSDSAYRAHDMLLSWSLANLSDGKCPADIHKYAPHVESEDLTELREAGLLSWVNGEWVLSRYEDSQSSAAKIEASLENRRKSDRVRQARKRKKDKEALEKELEELGDADSGNEQVSRDSHVSVGNSQGWGYQNNQPSRDNHVSVVMLNADDDKELKAHYEKAVAPADSGVSYSGSFENLPAECAEPSCSESAFGSSDVCYEHLTARRSA